MTTPALGFVGGGIMAEAMIGGVLAHGLTTPDRIRVFDPAEARQRHLAERFGLEIAPSSRQAAEGTDAIVLAVKPQVMRDATGDLRHRLQPDQLVVSIAAGITLGALAGRLEHPCVVRVMPNTPAQIGQGISVWTATDQVTDVQHRLAQSLLEALGPAIFVDQEHYLDMATAVSGSGPAYVFLVIEAMIDAAVEIGLARPMATDLVLQTLAGSTAYARETGLHPAILRNQVTSPGGTTAAGIGALEAAGLRAAFANAISAAHRRAQELGD